MNKERAVNFLDEMGNFNFISKYARYNEVMSRRETWHECVKRVSKMHLDKFDFLPKEDLAEIKWAFDLVDSKHLVPSMRSMQFGGKAILAHNARIYNCATRHVDSVRAFAELFYLLLSGCGVGIGLTRKYLNRLPDLVGPKDKTGTIITYTIQDSVEGWADTVEALLSCYFKNNAYSGRKIVFDYSRIRPEGAPIKTGGGKAPGYKGLKRSLNLIKELLDYIIEDLHLKRMRSIDAYDTLMHCADAVLSGGIRRSASTVIFDADDVDMLNAKTFFNVSKHTKFSYDEDTKLHYGKVVVEGKKYDVELLDYDYEQLKNTKTISWFYIEPQRARSNNSTLLLRSNVTREKFLEINEQTKQFGEPGFVFANSEDQLFNPCFDRNTRIATDKGLIKIGELYETRQPISVATDNRIGKGDELFSDKGVTIRPATQVHLTQKQASIYELTTEHGNALKVTENHEFTTPHGRKQLKDLQEGDTLFLQSGTGVFGNMGSYNEGLLLGLVTGDGTFGNNNAIIQIWKDDFDALDLIKNSVHEAVQHIPRYNDAPLEEFADVIPEFSAHNSKKIQSSRVYQLFKEMGISDPKTIKQFVPECVWRGSEVMVKGYLHGMIFTDGSVNLKCVERGKNATLNIELVQSNKQLLQEIQIILNNFGVVSRLYKVFDDNHPSVLPDGKGGSRTYLCKANYRLSINRPNAIRFLEVIGLMGRKEQKLKDLLDMRGYDCNKPERYTTKVKSIIFSHTDDVFCFTQSQTNSTIANGLAVGQCFEIGMIPITKDGVCGVQFCNLTTINGLKITTKEDFFDAVKAATIIGTLQATYTDFSYLGNASKIITEDEALLGVSIGGLMNNPEILLDKSNQQVGAEIAKTTNAIWAKKLGIKPAARITCIKPDGNTGATLGCASGIHPYHNRRFFRRIQCNKNDTVYKFFKKHNPHMCESSVWSSNKTDDVITFPITVPDQSMIKSDLSALKHLEIIKDTQLHWVVPGTTEFNRKPITHNVSCTVSVDEHEWIDVFNYIYDNKQSFAAVSLLPKTGDKIYKQAPNESIVTEEDETRWNDLVSKYKHVDYKLLEEDEDTTKAMENLACAGGKCDI